MDDKIYLATGKMVDGEFDLFGEIREFLAVDDAKNGLIFADRYAVIFTADNIVNGEDFFANVIEAYCPSQGWYKPLQRNSWEDVFDEPAVATATMNEQSRLAAAVEKMQAGLDLLGEGLEQLAGESIAEFVDAFAALMQKVIDLPGYQEYIARREGISDKAN